MVSIDNFIKEGININNYKIITSKNLISGFKINPGENDKKIIKNIIKSNKGIKKITLYFNYTSILSDYSTSESIYNLLYVIEIDKNYEIIYYLNNQLNNIIKELNFELENNDHRIMASYIIWK